MGFDNPSHSDIHSKLDAENIIGYYYPRAKARYLVDFYEKNIGMKAVRDNEGG